MPATNENLIKFQENLKNNVGNFEEIVQKDNWVFKYDKISDILYFAPKDKQASIDSALLPINGSCSSIRVNKDGFFEGIMVEDFLSLYVPDNKEFEPLAKAIKKARSKEVNSKDYKAFWKAFLFDSLRVKNLTPSYT